MSDRSIHLYERFVWGFLCLISWAGFIVLVISSWNQFQNNAISYVVETSYLSFNTSFPAISVCEKNSEERLFAAATKLFGENRDMNLDEVINELSFYSGNYYYTKETCSSKSEETEIDDRTAGDLPTYSQPEYPEAYPVGSSGESLNEDVPDENESNESTTTVNRSKNLDVEKIEYPSNINNFVEARPDRIRSYDEAGFLKSNRGIASLDGSLHNEKIMNLNKINRRKKQKLLFNTDVPISRVKNPDIDYLDSAYGRNVREKLSVKESIKNCPIDDFKKIALAVRSSCDSILTDCRWKGMPFNCCDHFGLTMTEIGPCYTLRSDHQQFQENDSLNFFSNNQIGLASLFFKLNTTAQVYMHTNHDVPYLNSLSSEIFTPDEFRSVRVGIKVNDITNDAEIPYLSIRQRNCRFPFETDGMKVSNIYSYSHCITECRVQESLRRCGCVHHWIPNYDDVKVCDLEGSLCLYEHSSDLLVVKLPWSQSAGIVCSCLPSCLQPQYNTVLLSQHEIDVKERQFQIYLMSLSSERNRRNIVRGRMDLVVSMGGSGGLFVGASLLSFLEFIFFFIFRLRRK